jgi:hypothetical protein
MRFCSLAPLAALGITPGFAQYRSNEHRNVNSTPAVQVVSRAGAGAGAGASHSAAPSRSPASGVIASRRCLRGGLNNHLDAAMPPMHLSAIAFFVFFGAASLVAVVGVGGGNGSSQTRGGLFPGPARIVCAEINAHLSIIFGVMAKRRIHVETDTRSQRAIAALQHTSQTPRHTLQAGQLVQGQGHLTMGRG